jgi:membrane protein involved in colicin uptake
MERVMRKWLAIAAVMAFTLAPIFALAQQATPPPSAHQHETAAEGKTDTDMMKQKKDKQAKHEKMMAEMKAMDARLDEKLAAMNAAKGDKKVEAMAAVINELVAQRKEMREHFGGMHRGMGGPMMGHGGMMQCPMMQHHGGMQSETPKKEGAQ